MKGRFWTIGLVTTVLLLAGCATVVPRPAEDVSVATAPPTEEQSPTAEPTDLPPTEEQSSATTATNSPPTPTPSPTTVDSTLPPSPTAEPAPTEEPSPTVEPLSTTASSPTPVATVPSLELTTSDVQRIAVAEARTLLDAGQAVLYDTRSAQSYRTLHAAGAISLPESEAPGRVDELPTDQALIFY
jgi:hypothetical protein